MLAMRALLVSTYDLGRQPFGLASPAAWLRRDGVDVQCVDVAKERLPDQTIQSADLVAFHLPMHTATRLAAPLIRKIRALNPSARMCAYGLYAPLNADWLRSIGVDDVLDGEFEQELAAIAREVPTGSKVPPISDRVRSSGPLPRLQFLVPDRSTLPPLAHYATSRMPDFQLTADESAALTAFLLDRAQHLDRGGEPRGRRHVNCIMAGRAEFGR